MNLGLSYSAIRDFELCPLRYHYKHVLKEKESFEALTNGRLFHAILEEYGSHLLATQQESDWDMAQKIAQKWASQAPDSTNLLEVVGDYLASFKQPLEGLLGHEIKIAVDEDWHLADWDSCFFKGVLDRAYYVGGRGVVIDYKTGERIAYDRRQFALYGALLQAHLGQEVPIVGVVVFPRFAYEEQFLIEQKHVDLAKEWVRAVAEQIQGALEEGFEGRIGEHCITCPFKWRCQALQNAPDIDWDLIKKADTPELLLEEYARLSARLEVIKEALKELTEDRPITYAGLQAGYTDTKTYVWDVESVLEDIRDRGLAGELLKLDSRKALKYDWIKERALVGVKKTSRWVVKKAERGDGRGRPSP